ncbi:MAG: hypothetical protein WCZ23_06395 [Rhodospirillaceae bacterium]
MILALYLALFVAWLTVPLGSLALLALHRMFGGTWGRLAEPVLVRACRLLPVTGVLFLPVLIWLDVLYPWARPGWEGQGGKAVWLSEPFFIGRAVFYFVAWIAAERFLLRPGQGMAPAVVALTVFTLTASLAGVDWVMTLDPEFNSSIFGLWFMSQLVVGALAFVTAACLLRGPPPKEWKSFAAVLLAATMLWAYLGFTQFLVIWSTDLPHEVVWYLDRSGGMWTGVLWLIGLAHGAILLLLMTVARHIRVILAGVAVLLVVLRVVEAAWMVVPVVG